MSHKQDRVYRLQLASLNSRSRQTGDTNRVVCGSYTLGVEHASLKRTKGKSYPPKEKQLLHFDLPEFRVPSYGSVSDFRLET